MASAELERVIDHLRGLAARSLAALELPPAEQLPTLRRIINDYVNVDPCVTEVVAEVQTLEVHGRKCEWFTTSKTRPDRRLLYIHGGSWVKGGLDSHRTVSARIAQVTGCSVLAVDYRLAPEHPFPAGLEDCVATFLWMLDNGPDGPSNTRYSFIAGDSAGGNLTLASLLSLRDGDHHLPNGAVAFSPATDFTNSGESIRTRAEADPVLLPETLPICATFYLQHGHSLSDPLASPLFGNLAGLPPLLIQVGDAEILLDDSRRFAERARAAGVDVSLKVWPEMPHVFQAFAPFLPEAVEALDHVGEFVEQICGSD